MKRNILQIPIKTELRKKAEMKAESLGFSSLQEMVRVLLTQMVNSKRENVDFKVDDLCEKYGINYLGLFGSMARGEAKEDSDVDLLVKFDNKHSVGLFKLSQIQKDFEKRFGRRVDLVTKTNKYIQPYIKKDLMTVYEKR